MHVRTNHVPSSSRYYLTPGKLYPVVDTLYSDRELIGVEIVSDSGYQIYTSIRQTRHLDGGDWEIVGEPSGLTLWQRLVAWARSLF